MKRIRILMADDHTLICAGFQKLLEPLYEVVDIAADGLALLESVAKLLPDIVILDIGMPLLNGIDAARELKRKIPKIKLVFLTMNADLDIASEAMRLGASAYLLKNSRSTEFLQAIHDVTMGLTYISPQVKRAMDESFVEDPRIATQPKVLSHRQKEVLQMLAEGRSMKEIAYDLKITHRTVRFHKSRIMEDLHLSTNSALVMYAVKHGIVRSA
jgi:DNA-binding NarL/FixJ family response regulator